LINIIGSIDIENHAGCDGAGARHLPHSTNQDFPCPAWKIAIGSLTTSALAALATCLPTAPERFSFFFSLA